MRRKREPLHGAVAARHNYVSFRHEQTDRFPVAGRAFRRAPKRHARRVLACVGIETGLHNDACKVVLLRYEAMVGVRF